MLTESAVSLTASVVDLRSRGVVEMERVEEVMGCRVRMKVVVRYILWREISTVE